MLILAFVFVRWQDPDHQPTAYLLKFREYIAAYIHYLHYFRATIPIQPWRRAWSDVSCRCLASAISDPTILQITQRELHCCCQLKLLDPI